MMNKHIRRVIVTGIIVLLLAGGVILVAHKKQQLAAAPKFGMQPLPVRVASAREGDLQQTQEYLAVVEPIRTADVSARITADVEQVLHNENQFVKTGDTLVVLDSRQIKQSIASAHAQVEQAQADLASNHATVSSLQKTLDYWRRESQRDKQLAEKGAIPGSQAEGTAEKANEAQGQLDAARQESGAIEQLIASLQSKQDELETTLGYYTIRSPFGGLISHKSVDPGDLAVPGKSLMVVEDRGMLKLAFDVPQQDLPHVREGLAVVFTVAGKQRTAAISHMYPSLSAARMLRAEVYLEGADMEGLVSGAYVPLRVIVATSSNIIFVPSTAVIESATGQPYVFVVNDQQLHSQSVRVLGAAGNEVAVEGVHAGDQVVLNTFLGWAQLSSGLKVEAMK